MTVPGTALNRLKRVHEYTGNPQLDWQQEFLYDQWGNRRIDVANTYGTGINNKSFDKEDTTNRLYAPGDLALADSLRQIRYDVAGNQIKDAYTGYGAATFDGENRIVAIQDNSAGWSYYTYNANGQRVRRKIGNQETWQIYGIDGELVAEYPANGALASPQKEYGYRNGQLLVTAEPSAPTGVPNVTWTNVVGVTVSGNSLTRGAAPVGWTAGASSSQTIASGDGYVEFTAAETNTNRMCGLSNGDTNQDYTDIDFALYLFSDGTFYVFEGGVNKGNFGSYASGDRFRVAVEGGVVKYRRNGTLVFSSGVTPTYPLLVDTALSIPNATINNVTFSANQVENVQWTTAVNVTVTGNSLTKPTSGNVAWDAGAVSIKAIASGNGYVEFTAAETNTNRMAGLSNGDSNQDYADIDFAIYLFSDGHAYIFEGGANKGGVGSYASGDTFRVAVESGVVKYRKNGTLLYTSSITPTYPLLVDTAISVPGGTLNNVKLSGTLAGGTAAKINWLVSDHLSTPRMVIDQTGSLANLKRHDYLPFGEQLFAGTGGRTTALGYSGGDGVRQQFTSYERDNETGLDYAHARYYSSIEGRFTTTDPLMASGQSIAPQTWNRYSYGLNNPLKYIDPSGLISDDISTAKDERRQQEEQRQQQQQPPQQPNPTQSAPATQTAPQTPTSVTAEVPPPDTLVNIPFNGNYINGVGSIIRFTIRNQNGDAIPNVTVLESVTPRTTIQNPNFVTFPDGIVTDLVGRGTETSQPLTRQQAGNVIVPILATPTPPVVQDHMMIIMSPSGGSAIATHQRSYTNLDAQGHLVPFVNPQTGRSMSNFSITVSPVTVVKMPTVMCPRF